MTEKSRAQSQLNDVPSVCDCCQWCYSWVRAVLIRQVTKKMRASRLGRSVESPLVYFSLTRFFPTLFTLVLPKRRAFCWSLSSSSLRSFSGGIAVAPSTTPPRPRRRCISYRTSDSHRRIFDCIPAAVHRILPSGHLKSQYLPQVLASNGRALTLRRKTSIPHHSDSFYTSFTLPQSLTHSLRSFVRSLVHNDTIHPPRRPPPRVPRLR